MWAPAPSFTNLLYLASLLTLEVLASPVPGSPDLSDSLEPTPVSITPSFVANVAENTYTSTVGLNGDPTSVPIVGGAKCWFCPANENGDEALGGWALFGIESPGTYQPSTPSGFLEPIPVIFVSSDGYPTYAPSKTTDETVAKVRRDNLPTQTVRTSTIKYKILDQNFPKNVESVNDGDGFALRTKHVGSFMGIKYPKHYMMVAGWIVIQIKHQDIYDECDDNQVVGVKEIYRLDWNATSFDVWAAKGDSANELHMSEEPDFVETWHMSKVSDYTYLGPLKKGLSRSIIHETGLGIADDMNRSGGHSYLRRNCKDFVMKLWKTIKAWG